MITVTTVLKSGGIYDHTWVDKLKRGLYKHLKIPFNFLPISDYSHEYAHNTFIQENPKYWNKIELFRPELYTGKTLYFDLDTVILGDITDMVKSFDGSKFLMYNDTSHNNGAMSCIMYWEGDQSVLWDQWNTNTREYWYKKYAGGNLGDQAFVRDHIKYELIQDKVPSTDHFYFVTKKELTKKELVNKDIRILVYAGKNRKPHLSNWQIIKQEWI